MTVTLTADFILARKERYTEPMGLAVDGTLVVKENQITLKGDKITAHEIIIDDENMRKQFCTESQQREYPHTLVAGRLLRKNEQLILTKVRQVFWTANGQNFSCDFE